MQIDFCSFHNDINIILYHLKNMINLFVNNKKIFYIFLLFYILSYLPTNSQTPTNIHLPIDPISTQIPIKRPMSLPLLNIHFLGIIFCFPAPNCPKLLKIFAIRANFVFRFQCYPPVKASVAILPVVLS